MVPYESISITPEKVKRTIGVISGKEKTDSIVFFAGIHGNEPAGILALERVLSFIKKNNIPFKGNLWAIQGNLPALKMNKRYLDKDLNRIWLTRYNDIELNPNGVSEIQEREELKIYIEKILNQSSEKVYFFDLHTTSSQSIPFVSISDTLRNRQIVNDIPVPIVLGLEEQMEGTLFSFFSELGISMILFEAGQHESISSVDNLEAFIWLLLSNLNFINKDDIPEFHIYWETLAKDSIFRRRIFQLKYSHHIEANQKFRMNPGFVNFQPVKKGETLAEDLKGAVKSPFDGRIFMPLYQNQGGEGFFVISEIRKLWLQISEYLRKMELDRFMYLLPGVKKHEELPECFLINRRIAGFFVLDFFHLLGYRKVIRQDKRYIVKRRSFDREQPPIQIVKDRFHEITFKPTINGQAR